MKTLIALMLLVGLCGAHPAGAAPSDRINEAQAAAVAQERVFGEVIDVERDEAEEGEPRGPVYEVRVLTPAGDVVSVRVSGVTGRYLGAEGPDLARALRPPSSPGPSP